MYGNVTQTCEPQDKKRVVPLGYFRTMQMLFPTKASSRVAKQKIRGRQNLESEKAFMATTVETKQI